LDFSTDISAVRQKTTKDNSKLIKINKLMFKRPIKDNNCMTVRFYSQEQQNSKFGKMYTTKYGCRCIDMHAYCSNHNIKLLPDKFQDSRTVWQLSLKSEKVINGY